MATPTLTFAASRTTTSGTTFTPTLPSGTGRVFVPVSCPSNTALTTSSTDWFAYKIVPNGTGLCCTWFVSKVAAGSSPGALVVNSAASTLFSTVAIRSDLVRTRLIMGIAPATGTGSNANPGVVDQLASRATRFVEILTLAGTGVASAASSGYSGLTTQAGASGGASTCVAHKSATASSDDPGAWTHGSAAYIAQTVALVDGGTAWDDEWRAAAQGLAANGVNVPVNFWGDSLTAGATHASTGMAANQHATARPALFAAGLTVGLGSSKTWLGVGGANVTSGQLNAYDNRRTPGTNWDHSRGIGYNSLGGGFLTCSSGTASLAFTPGGSWDRHRVLFATYPSSPQYTTKVDAGSATTLLMNAANSITWSSPVSGSGTTINIASTAAGGFVLATEVYTNGTPQISVFNGGWFGSNSTQNTALDWFGPVYAAAALAAKLTVICIGSNDPSQGVTTDQTEYNIQLMTLVGLITGSVVIETPPYASGGTEAAQDALLDKIEHVADALCVGFIRISTKTGWTSYATAVSSGYMTSGDNHPTTAGYANWSTYELEYMDPGPVRVATGALVGPGASVVGAAARTRTHASTGALAGAGAEVTGSAARTHIHTSTGVLSGAGSTVTGSAARTHVHTTSGVLAGLAASVVGASAVAYLHPTSGALTGAGAAVSGSAERAHDHPTSGALTGPGSTVVGSSARTPADIPNVHPTSGALTGPGSAVGGVSARMHMHPTSGALTGPGSAVGGSATRTHLHPTSGALTGPGSSIVGSTTRTHLFDTAGALVGGGATAAGSADISTGHITIGALTGPGSLVGGSAVRFRQHATAGVLAGPGSPIAATASRTPAVVNHAASGALAGPGGVLAGASVVVRSHAATGALVGPAANIGGTAARTHTAAFDSALAWVLTGKSTKVSLTGQSTRMQIVGQDP